MKDEVLGILSETIKIRMDIDNNVVIPRVIFSSRISFTVIDEKKPTIAKQILICIMQS
jgi:hypothetical protein